MKRIPAAAATHTRGTVSRNRFASKTRFSMSVEINEYDEGETVIRRFRVRPEATMPAVLRERSRRRAAIRAVRLRGGSRTRQQLMKPVTAGSITLKPASPGFVELTPREGAHAPSAGSAGSTEHEQIAPPETPDFVMGE